MVGKYVRLHNPGLLILCEIINLDLNSCRRSLRDEGLSLLPHELMKLKSAHPSVFQAFRTQNVSSSANVVTLPNLKAWTWYCVTVQSRYDFYNKNSAFTVPLCMQTEGNTF